MALSAALAQRPHVGGHTWMALQWLLGFRALGWDVLLIDRLEPAMCRNPAGEPCAPEHSTGVAYLASVMEQFGLADAWTVLVPDHDPVGAGRVEPERWLESCELLLNVMGYLDDAEVLSRAPLRVFVDIDPGFGQMWKALGLHDLFEGHDRFVTVGGNVGREECDVPDLGLDWVTTLPPVALEHWPVAPGGDAITSVATWRGPFGPIEYGGRTYGLRVHEFRRFVELPRRTCATFEIALAIEPEDAADIARLDENGWQRVDPHAVAGTPDAYRDFIRGSAGELNVAKSMYVDTLSGWFSDRSACYLASGKPVLAQDTGFGGALPTGDGLLAFATFDDAVAGIEAILAHPEPHARAARALAEEHLAADRVITRLLDELGVG